MSVQPPDVMKFTSWTPILIDSKQAECYFGKSSPALRTLIAEQTVTQGQRMLLWKEQPCSVDTDCGSNCYAGPKVKYG